MLLLIPGPVMTHPTVRAAAGQDIAPWDNEVRLRVAHLLRRLCALAGGVEGKHVAMPLPGSGHFMDAGHGAGGGILIPATGQYADRMMRLAREAGRRVTSLDASLSQPLDPAAVEAALIADPSITHLGLVYSETSTGVIHDPAPMGAMLRRLGRRMILDAVSAFGALPIDMAAQPEIDATIFTPNKCLEGLPGFSIAVCPVDRLVACHGHAGSWSFDLGDLHHNAIVNGPGAARFTPPAQAMAALAVALDRLDAEGGPPARLARYRDNMATLRDGLEGLGLRPFLPRETQGPIIMNVHAPAHAKWDLQRFVDALKQRGVTISNFRNTVEPSMRVGAIGAIDRADMLRAVAAFGETLDAIGLTTLTVAA
jgi:2-aminoethylphosphonate-pyruvate transaminase